MGVILLILIVIAPLYATNIQISLSPKSTTTGCCYTTPTGVALLTNFVEGKNLHFIFFGHTEKVAVLQVMLACIYVQLLQTLIPFYNYRR